MHSRTGGQLGSVGDNTTERFTGQLPGAESFARIFSPNRSISGMITATIFLMERSIQQRLREPRFRHIAKSIPVIYADLQFGHYFNWFSFNLRISSTICFDRVPGGWKERVDFKPTPTKAFFSPVGRSTRNSLLRRNDSVPSECLIPMRHFTPLPQFSLSSPPNDYIPISAEPLQRTVSISRNFRNAINAIELCFVRSSKLLRLSEASVTDSIAATRPAFNG